MFDFDTYAQRIGISSLNPTEAGLAALQRAQLAAIAFENIEPLLGRVPSLQPADLWAKLVLQKRGGYCFELNWLFGEALKHLGFQAKPLLGRVRMGAPVGGIRSHFAWIVTIGGQDWLADAGFGGPGPREPIALRDDEQVIAGTTFRFRGDPETGERVLERRNPGGWFALFGFDGMGFAPIDVEASNYLCAQWPRQPFCNSLRMSIRLPDEDVALLNRGLKRTSVDGVTTAEIGSAEELAKHFRELFGLAYDDETIVQIWTRLDEISKPTV